MTNPPILVITGLGGYFILNFLQKSGYNNSTIIVKMQELFLILFIQNFSHEFGSH